MNSITYRPLDNQEHYPYFYGVTLKPGDEYYEEELDLDYEQFNKGYLSIDEWGIHELHQIAIQTDDERILIEIALNSHKLLIPKSDEDFDFNAPGEAAASKIKSLENVRRVIDRFISDIYLWEDYQITQSIFEHLIHFLDDNDRFRYFELISEKYPRSEYKKRNDKSQSCEIRLFALISEEDILLKILKNPKYIEFHEGAKNKLKRMGVKTLNNTDSNNNKSTSFF